MSNELGTAGIAEDFIFFGSEVLSQFQSRLKLVSTVRRDYQGSSQAPGSTIQVPSIKISGSATERSIGDAAREAQRSLEEWQRAARREMAVAT